MKKLLLLLVAVSCFSFAGEHDDTSNTEGGKRSEVKQVEDKSLKLFNFINACMTSPPTSATAVPQADTANLPAIADTGSAQPQANAGASASGEAAFQAKCMTCHAGAAPSLTGKKGSDVAAHVGADMPKKGSEEAKSITEAEKAAIKAFLSSKATL